MSKARRNARVKLDAPLKPTPRQCPVPPYAESAPAHRPIFPACGCGYLVQIEISPGQSPRHTAPAATTTHASQRFPLTASRRNTRPISTANTTLVSRNADTAPIAPDCNAQITMPYAAIDTSPPASDEPTAMGVARKGLHNAANPRIAMNSP